MAKIEGGAARSMNRQLGGKRLNFSQSCSKTEVLMYGTLLVHFFQKLCVSGTPPIDCLQAV